MKALGERSIASFVRFVLDAVWWLGVVALSLFLVLLPLKLFVNNVAGDNLTMDLPVSLELDVPIHGNSGSVPTEARLDRVHANLRFPVRKGSFVFGNMILVVLVLSFLLWALAQLRHIFRSLSRGLLFIPENARRIRRVGFAVIFGELARAALVYFWSYYTSLHFTANGMRFVASLDLNGTTIISGFAILVIAEVFREGTQLKEDQSLTI